MFAFWEKKETSINQSHLRWNLHRFSIHPSVCTAEREVRVYIYMFSSYRAVKYYITSAYANENTCGQSHQSLCLCCWCWCWVGESSLALSSAYKVGKKNIFTKKHPLFDLMSLSQLVKVFRLLLSNFLSPFALSRRATTTNIHTLCVCNVFLTHLRDQWPHRMANLRISMDFLTGPQWLGNSTSFSSLASHFKWPVKLKSSDRIQINWLFVFFFFSFFGTSLPFLLLPVSSSSISFRLSTCLAHC